MAENDPKAGAAAFPLDLGARDREFLLEVLTMARDGAREELAEGGQRRPERESLRREERALERLARGVERGCIVPDADSVAALRELAAVVDSSNDYRRVVAEHDALQRAIAGLQRPRDRCSGRRGVRGRSRQRVE